MKTYFNYFFSFILLLLIQVFVLNNINLFGYINPYLYILLILSLPFKIKHTPLIFISFLVGYIVDLLSGGIIGLHSAAAVLIGFIRPFIIRGISSNESEYDTKSHPSLNNMGVKWYITYCMLLVGAHHLLYYYLECFTFSSFFSTFFRSLFNTLFTVFIIVIYQMVSFKVRKR